MTNLIPKPQGRFKVGDKIYSQHINFPDHRVWYTVIRVTATQAIAKMGVSKVGATIKVRADYNGHRCFLVGNKDRWGQTYYFACETQNSTSEAESDTCDSE